MFYPWLNKLRPSFFVLLIMEIYVVAGQLKKPAEISSRSYEIYLKEESVGTILETKFDYGNFL